MADARMADQSRREELLGMSHSELVDLVLRLEKNVPQDIASLASSTASSSSHAASDSSKDVQDIDMEGVDTVPSTTHTASSSSSASSSPRSRTPSSPKAKKTKGASQQNTNEKEKAGSNTQSDKGKSKGKAKTAGFDPNVHYRRKIALRIAYIGTKYHGFACQLGTKETVLQYILSALTKTCLIGPDVSQCGLEICGRTDSGVHAFGQVLSVIVRCQSRTGLGVLKPGEEAPKCRALRPGEEEDEGVKEEGGEGEETANEEKEKDEVCEPNSKKRKHGDSEGAELNYPHMLNRCLPDDIQVVAWAPVPLNFSARFGCSSRLYKYLFFADNMDIARMNAAAQKFAGAHDFRHFCKIDPTGHVTNFVRKMLRVEVGPATVSSGLSSRTDQLYELTVEGQAFLWHQIRCMVAILFMIGKGHATETDIERMLQPDKFPEKPQYSMAPPNGLILYDTSFPALTFNYDETAHRRLVGTLHAQWREQVLGAAVLQKAWQNVLNNLLCETVGSGQADSGDDR